MDKGELKKYLTQGVCPPFSEPTKWAGDREDTVPMFKAKSGLRTEVLVEVGLI